MPSPNYLGTRSGLTGVPTLLISSIRSVKETATQTALYQIQNWANSFFTFNYAVVSTNYTTGGVPVTYANPFASTVVALVATPFGVSNAAQAQVVLPLVGGPSLTGATIILYTPAGVQLGAGVACLFSYIAIGH